MSRRKTRKNQELKASIIIRTLNEGKYLRKLIEQINSQSYRNYEIIVVDSGSTDNTCAIARELNAILIRMPKGTFTYGRALNIGFQHARGDICVSLSAHVELVSNKWLENLLQPYRDPSIVMTYGRQIGHTSSMISEVKYFEDLFGPNNILFKSDILCNNANCSYRRSEWQEFMFDELLPALEDVDWCYNRCRRGKRSSYVAGASIVHIHNETTQKIYRRYYSEANAITMMFPHFKISRIRLLYKMLANILKDIRFNKTNEVWNGTTSSIFQFRIAQYLGALGGYNAQNHIARKIVNSFLAGNPQRQQCLSTKEIREIETSFQVDEVIYEEYRDSPENGNAEDGLAKIS